MNCDLYQSFTDPSQWLDQYALLTTDEERQQYDDCYARLGPTSSDTSGTSSDTSGTSSDTTNCDAYSEFTNKSQWYTQYSLLSTDQEKFEFQECYAKLNPQQPVDSNVDNVYSLLDAYLQKKNENDTAKEINQQNRSKYTYDLVYLISKIVWFGLLAFIYFYYVRSLENLKQMVNMTMKTVQDQAGAIKDKFTQAKKAVQDAAQNAVAAADDKKDIIKQIDVVKAQVGAQLGAQVGAQAQKPATPVAMVAPQKRDISNLNNSTWKEEDDNYDNNSNFSQFRRKK
jgi:hypothetical protein